MKLHPVKIGRVIASTKEEFAVVLEAEAKTFLIFVGSSEAYAIFREVKGTKARRPLPHDLIANVFQGFEIRVKSVVISSIVSSTFCATIFLEQIDGEAPGRRREVKLDLRASDAMILALKSGCDLHVTETIIEQVEDVSELLGNGDDDALDSGFGS